MATPVLPPNPCLLAIILITKTRDGTNEVFHYPPHAGQDRRHRRSGSAASGYISDSTRVDSSSDDEYANDHEDSHVFANGSNVIIDESGSVSPEKSSARDMWESQDLSRRNSLLGLPEGFHHFLCPPSSFNRKRFEMTIDRLVFLGWPAFARDDGTWRRKKAAKKNKKKQAYSKARADHSNGIDMARRSSVQTGSLLEMTSEADSTAEHSRTDTDDVSGFEAGYGHDALEEEPKKERLNMFNVVFVMDPSPVEYHHRVDEMYKHVVKKFSKALRWEQSRSNLVLKESERLRNLKGKHSSMATILKHSPLARAIADLYTSISSSRIAHVELTRRVSFSLHLPVPSSISVLPSLTEPQLPGVWLTTANSFALTDDPLEIENAQSRLASHFGLLLLKDAASIIAEVSAAQSPLAPALEQYLRYSKPTKSLVQIAQNSSISLANVQMLASHLIYWRRARAIPPLHHRDIYIVSPNADMRKLKSAAAQYARQFPALPSLPKMLGLLGAGPRPYSTFIPSKDHKEAYLDILAWLMRGGWVTQLRTFAWVRVTPEILQKAQDMVCSEEAAKSSKTKAKDEDDISNSGSDDGKEPPKHGQTRSEFDAEERNLPSGYLTPLKSSVYSAASVNSGSTARTTVPLRSGRLQDGSAEEENGIDPKKGPILILSPSRASGMESKYLAVISTQMECDDGKDVREAWEKCLKYFNGEQALEKIAAREGWKRKKVEALRARWRNQGVLLEVRHW